VRNITESRTLGCVLLLDPVNEKGRRFTVNLNLKMPLADVRFRLKADARRRCRGGCHASHPEGGYRENGAAGRRAGERRAQGRARRSPKVVRDQSSL